MTITREQLRAIMPNIEGNIAVNRNFSGYTLTGITDLINKHAVAFSINTPRRMAHFLAQIALECGEFRATQENLNYSAEGLLRVFPRYFNAQTAKMYARNPERIASKVYANRMGNGTEASKDGWNYRGRGCIQITGKCNYTEYNEYLKKCGLVVDLLKTPELLARPVGAIKSAMWFWAKHGLNELADQDAVTMITKRINGGLNGIEQRKKYLARAKQILLR